MNRTIFIKIIEFIAVTAASIFWFHYFCEPYIDYYPSWSTECEFFYHKLKVNSEVPFLFFKLCNESQYPPLLYYMQNCVSIYFGVSSTKLLPLMLTAANIIATYYLGKKLAGIFAGILSFVLASCSLLTIVLSDLFLNEAVASLFITLFFISILHSNFNIHRKSPLVLAFISLSMALLARPNALFYCFVPLCVYIKKYSKQIFSKSFFKSSPIINLFLFVTVCVVVRLIVLHYSSIRSFLIINNFSRLSASLLHPEMFYMIAVIWMMFILWKYRGKYPELTFAVSCVFLVIIICAPYYIFNPFGAEQNWHVYWDWRIANDNRANIFLIISGIIFNIIPLPILFPLSIILCFFFASEIINIRYVKVICWQCVAGAAIHLCLFISEGRFYYPLVSCFAVFSSAWLGIDIIRKRIGIAFLATMLCIIVVFLFCVPSHSLVAIYKEKGLDFARIFYDVVKP